MKQEVIGFISICGVLFLFWYSLPYAKISKCAEFAMENVGSNSELSRNLVRNEKFIQRNEKFIQNLLESYAANNGNNSKVVTVVLPLEEIKNQDRQKAIDPLLEENVAPDDPRLIKAIRDHFIDPPSGKIIKMSKPLVVTPQARAIDKIFDKKVNQIIIIKLLSC